MRIRLRGLPVSYPAHPHLTLRGFPPGTALRDIQALASSWAESVPALSVELDGAFTFPTPLQIVVLRVRKSAPLVDAFLQLDAASRQAGLPDWPEAQRRSPDSWVFHISLAYCGDLASSVWSDLQATIPSLKLPRVSCIVAQAELVAFDDGREVSGGSYALSGDCGNERPGW